MKIYIIGDTGVDHYTVGTVRGLSAEAPIPVLDVKATYVQPGMAGNVAANLARFGGEGAQILPPTQGILPIKRRLFTEEGQQVARWDENDVCPAYTKRELVHLMNADAVIVCDYGKGSITPEVVEILKDMRVPLFVDTKQDPLPWSGSDSAILFPNKSEWEKYKEHYGWLPRVVLKLGPSGAAYVEFGQVILQRPSQARRVQCVNGAGDTVIAAFAMSYLMGVTVVEALEVSMVAAGLVVEQPFNERTVDPIKLRDRTHELYGLRNQDQGANSGSGNTLPGFGNGDVQGEQSCGGVGEPCTTATSDGDGNSPSPEAPLPRSGKLIQFPKRVDDVRDDS